MGAFQEQNKVVKKGSPVVDALTKLQKSVRRGQPANERSVMTRKIPEGQQTGQYKTMLFYRDEVEAAENLKSALVVHLNFEHIDRVDDVVWDFAMTCALNKTTNYVPGFVESNSRDIESHTCFMPVEHLVVKSGMQFAGVTLLPVDDTAIPTSLTSFPMDRGVGSFAAVRVSGTNYGAMADRARETAGHSLRKLRTVLQGTNLSLHPVQLRFRLGRAFAFSNDLHGWKNDSEIAYDIELTDATLLRANEQTASTMVEHPVKDIDKRADIALRWIERALLTGDSVISLLFLFFALEALLGDSAEGLKAHGLAFRRAMLSHVTEGTFTHPDTTYLLYDEIRSSAVHGEKVALLSEDQVRHFAGDVQRALNQYLEIATTNGMLKRAQMRRFLDQHEDVPKLIDWLRTNAHPDWEDYFERTSS